MLKVREAGGVFVVGVLVGVDGEEEVDLTSSPTPTILFVSSCISDSYTRRSSIDIPSR